MPARNKKPFATPGQIYFTLFVVTPVVSYAFLVLFDSVVGALLPVVYAAVIFAVVRVYSPRGREASTASNVAATAGFVLALVVAGFVFFIVMLFIGLSGSFWC